VKPMFTKNDVIEYINTYTNLNTINAYMSAYDNTRHRSPDTHLPNFTSDDLLRPEFLEDLKKHKKFKHMVSPLPSFLKKYNDSPGIKDLITRIQRYIKELSVQYLLTAVSRADIPLVISRQELIDTFEQSYTRLIDVNRKNSMSRESRAELFNLAIISGLYGHVSAFRDDIGHVNLTDKTGDNYLDEKTLYINTHKTASTYGRSAHVLPEDLLEIIAMSRLEFDRKYLIINENDTAKKIDKVITALLKKALNKKVTLTDIRRAWTTESLTSAEDTIDTAANLNHSVQTALLVYRRA
jgi:hypothetical protein